MSVACSGGVVLWRPWSATCSRAWPRSCSDVGSALESLALGATALFVVAGHNWPAPLGFRGGKGVAASCGALLALDLALAGVLVGIALVLLFATRRFTLSGLAAYAVAPGVALLLNRPPEFAALLGGLALLVLLPHHHELRAIVMPGRICRPSSPPTPTPSP
jgi:glycerol-3-phosphate acyltransferase PlsY